MIKRFLSLFSAEPVRSDYVDGADLFRVTCILLIAWFHIWQQSWLNPNPVIFGHRFDIYPLVTCGYLFVDSMILLSGFLLMLGKLNGRVKSLRGFYTARISRIIPCYYFFLIVQLAFYILPGHRFPNTEIGLIDTISHFTFTETFFYEGYIGTQFSGVLWTLAVEVWFYLIFPFVGEVFAKRPVRTWAVMVLFGFFSRYYVHRYCPDISMYFNQLPTMMDVYANGMIAAVIWVKLSKSQPKAWRAWISTLISIAACFAIYRIAKRQGYISGLPEIRQNQMDSRFLLSVAGSVLLIASGRSIVLFRRICSNPVTRFLSAISFNFYMWHAFIALRLKDWGIPPHINETPNMVGEQPWQTLYSIACFAAGIAVSALLTYAIEKPCAKALKKRFSLVKPK